MEPNSITMAEAKQPNIIFVMAGDHAAKAISAYGHGINATPNIDRLAVDGMLFNHCYVNNSICTPSRAAIITGTPHAHFPTAHDGNQSLTSDAGTHNHVNAIRTLGDSLNTWMPTVAAHLQYAGYQTAMIGKWHLGEGKAHEPRGFDYWYI